MLKIYLSALIILTASVLPGCGKKEQADDTPAIQGENTAENHVIPEELPRLLELGSVGCRPCDMMAPILDELREEYKGRLLVEFYDVRKNPAPAQKYRIRLIPTQIFLDAEGKEFFRHEGFFSKEEITQVLDSMGVAR